MTNDIQEIKKAELTQGQKFALKIQDEFRGAIGAKELSKEQQNLCYSFFSKIDSTLKTSELARLKKTGKYQDQTPVKWQYVDITKLSQDVVFASEVGLNPLVKNHMSIIPRKNNKTGKYELDLMPGYRGIELKARLYGVNVPKNVTAEVVRKNDKFSIVKKGVDRDCDSYSFEISNPFDRGEMIGAFYYMEYEDSTKNVICALNRTEIEKRKPEYASKMFWTKWEEEMWIKTMLRKAWGSVVIDSKKIDGTYANHERMQKIAELVTKENEVIETIAENQATEVIDITPGQVKEQQVSNVEIKEEKGEENGCKF